MADLEGPFSPNTPPHLLVDPENRTLIATPQVTYPTLQNSFKKADEKYLGGREQYLQFLANSVFTLGNMRSGKVLASLLYDRDDPNARTGEMLVVLSPLNDCAPLSGAETAAKYAVNQNPTDKEKEAAQPNSWSQLTKSANLYEVLKGEGLGMPVLTIFSPVHPMFNKAERKAIGKGDFKPYGYMVASAVHTANAMMYRPEDTVSFDKLHLLSAGLGQTVLGAAQWMKGTSWPEVASVTAQNLILGPRRKLDLLWRYSLGQHTGEPSELEVPEGYPRIREPAMRRELDSHGSEKAMRSRQLKAMTNFKLMNGLVKPEWTVDAIDELAASGMPITVFNAANSSATKQTGDYLTGVNRDNLTQIPIEAVAGQRVGLMSNEHVALGTAVAVHGIRNAKRLA